MKKEFLSGSVTKILGINQNLLTQWISRGQVKASKPASGSGSRNIFSVADICKIELFQQLIAVGLSRSQAAGVAFSGKENDLIEETINSLIKDWQEYCKEYSKELTTGWRTLLTGVTMPDPVYFLFEKKPEGTYARKLPTARDFGSLYDDQKDNILFHIVNISKIIGIVLKRIGEIEE